MPQADRVELEGLLGHVFRDRSNLERALTHSSLAYECATGRTAGGADGYVTVTDIDAVEQDNEQLEFLGDAILGLVVAECLFRTYPDLHEGDLTRLRARLVSRKHLGVVGAELELGRFLRLGKGEERSGGRQKAVLLANAMEAVVAALYLDGGMAAPEAFVLSRVVLPYLEELRTELDLGQAMGDHKSALQEWLQAHKAGAPQYGVKAETGPDHRKRFLVEAEVFTADGTRAAAEGLGSTKKKAEQEAARRVFQLLLKQEPMEVQPEPAEKVEALPRGRKVKVS